MALLYGFGGRLTAHHGGLWPGQKAAELADVHLGPDHEIARTLNTSRDAAVKVTPRA